MIGPIGALEQWRKELAAGLRTRYDFDALFRAACKEAEAAERARQGHSVVVDQLRREAAEIILEDVEHGAAA